MAERSPFDEINDVASRLTALMERENEYLVKHNPAGVKSLQDEKLALTRSYTAARTRDQARPRAPGRNHAGRPRRDAEPVCNVLQTFSK